MTDPIGQPDPTVQLDPTVQPGELTPVVQPEPLTPVVQPGQTAIPDSGWKQFLDFLWNGGFRSLIVLTVIVGAGWITVDNQKICPNVPTLMGNKEGTALVTNPTCSKYFDLVLAIIGGYLGLSLPSSSQGSSSQASNDPNAQNNQAGSSG